MIRILKKCFSLFQRTETVVDTPSYKATMRLTIFNVQRFDYGMYKCIAKNPRGETDGSIRLYCKLLPETMSLIFISTKKRLRFQFYCSVLNFTKLCVNQKEFPIFIYF